MGPPVTAVLVEDQIRVTIEQAIAEQKILPGGYVVCDPFETDGDVMRATLEAAQRQAERAEDEHMAALLYHWDAAALERVAEGGVLTATEPAPLDAATIIDCLEQLAHHPSYRHQLVVSISRDMEIVTMRDGHAKITTETPA
jgi:hypothetical protein